MVKAAQEGNQPAPIPSDIVLLDSVQQGDETAMATLFDRYSRLVYSVALRVLREPSLAEDVLQEIFLHIWRHPEAFIASRGTLGGWLAVSSRNRSIDVLRRRKPSQTIEEVLLPSGYDLAEEASRNEVVDKARAVIQQLPPVQKKALEMAFFEGLSHAEIADVTGDPLGTIKTRIRSGLMTLRKAFRT